MILSITIIFGWLFLNLAVGIVAKSDTEKDIEEWFVGSRTFDVMLLWFVFSAHWISAFSFLGGPGWAYSMGAPAFYIIVYSSMYPILYYVIMPKVCELGWRNKYITQTDLILDRYRNKFMALIFIVVSYITLIPYLAIQMMGVGYIFTVTTGRIISFKTGVMIAFGIVCAYVFTSGIRGVGWTTFVQGVFMFITGIGAAVFLFSKKSLSLSEMFHQIQSTHPEFLTLPGMGNMMSPQLFGTSILLSCLGGAMWPHLFQKFFTAKSVRITKLCSALAPLAGILNISVIIIGFSGILLIKKNIIPDEVLMEVVVQNLPTWFWGLVGAGILAAAMSTGSGIVHTLGSITGRDLYYRFIQTNAPDSRISVISKWAVVITTIFSFLFAIAKPSSLVYILLISYGGVTQFLPTIIGALFWPRATKYGVITGLIAGLLITIIFSFIPGLKHPFGIHGGFWGVLINFTLFITISLLTKPEPPQVLNRFF